MLILIGDKNFRGKQFEADLTALDVQILRPRRKDEPGHGPHLAPIRQRVESIYWTCKDILTFERHGARTLDNLRVRLADGFACRGGFTQPAGGGKGWINFLCVSGSRTVSFQHE